MTVSFPAFGQPYVFTRIVDDNTRRPDGKGNFNISGAPAVPSFDGQWVVFREYGPVNDASAQAIWSYSGRLGRRAYSFQWHSGAACCM